MPPKKKASKKASAQVKDAAVDREVQLLQFEQAKERLRSEEAELRQRIEEEEYRLLQDNRAREADVRYVVAERERNDYFEAREMELIGTVHMKEREVSELRAKVLGLQQAHQFMEDEKESAVRRAAMLSNELELTQIKQLEAEGKLDMNEKTSQDICCALERQIDSLRVKLSEVHGHNELLRKQNREMNERVGSLSPVPVGSTDSATEGDRQGLTAVEPRSADEETAVLLKVLHGEVERFKDTSAHLQAQLDHRNREEEKSSLLIGILNTQLDSVREENGRLHETAKKRLSELEAIQTVLQEEKSKSRRLYEEFDRATSEAAVQQRQLQLEVGVHKQQVEDLSIKHAELSREHRALTELHSDYVSRATQREKDDFEANVAMRSELERQKKDLASILTEKQTLQDELYHDKMLHRAEADSLKARLQKFQEAMETKDREAYESITVLRTAIEKMERENSVETGRVAEAKQRVKEELEETRQSRDDFQTKLEALQKHADAVEKELYEKLVYMTACHDAKHAEVDRLRLALQKKEEDASNFIFLLAEKETLKNKMEELQQQAHDRRQEHRRHIDAMTAELTELQRRLHAELSQQSDATKKEQSRADLAERNVQRLLSQINALQDTSKTVNVKHQDELKTAEVVARELREELRIAKRTIERLEGAIGDHAGYKQLTELNEKLSKDMEKYRAQAANLSNALASMKMEQDMMDGYKVQKLLEENEQLTRRVQQLDRVQRLAIPLFREVRSVVEKGRPPTSLRCALDNYDSQVGTLPVSKRISSVPYDPATDEEVAAANVTATLPAVVRPGSSQTSIVYASIDKPAAAPPLGVWKVPLKPSGTPSRCGAFRQVGLS